MRIEAKHKAITDIPGYSSWKKIIKINEGLSQSEKYQIMDRWGRMYLLRVASIREYARKQAIFMRMKALSKWDIPMPYPIEMGICNEGNSVYVLLSWISGIALDKVILEYNQEKQYQLGIQAGQLLRTMHDIKVSDRQIQRYRSKKEILLNRVMRYEKSHYAIKGDKDAINLVRQNINQIERMPICYLHGDYKMGNLVINEQSSLIPIDFDCCRVGDPYEDFVFNEYSNTRISETFARGKIDGYFNKQPPVEFWEALRVYIAAKVLTFILYYGRLASLSENKVYESARRVFKNYDYFNELVPIWYQLRK